MARTVQDLKKGDELVFSYTDPLRSLKERNKFGFECRCRLCEWQRNNPNDKVRETLHGQIRKLYERKLNEWSKDPKPDDEMIGKFDELHEEMVVMINQAYIYIV